MQLQSVIVIVAIFFATTSLTAGFSNASLHDVTGFSFGKVLEETEESSDASELESILFVGDIMLARSVERTLNTFGGTHPYQHLQSVFDDHTFQIGNFEAAIPKVHTPTKDFALNFSVTSEHAAALVDAGFTHLSLANNHSADFGSEAFLNTKHVLSDSGAGVFGTFDTVGTSSITFIKTNGKNVALIGIDATVNAPEYEALQSLFTYADEKSDFQIVFVHWGIEYKNNHSRMQESLAKVFVDLGADLVVGHHPHVVQDVTEYDGVPIFYSLGNFIFDQYFSPDVQTGLMLSVTVANTLEIALLPVSSIDSKVAPRLLVGYEKQIFLEKIAKRSGPRLYDGIAQGVIVQKNELATSP